MTTTTTRQVNDEDKILFGSTPHVVFGELSDRIDGALIDGASSLPLLPKSSGEQGSQEGGDEKIMKLLRKAYFKNIDLVEAYACRNIFSIQSYPPLRRSKIVQAFLSKNIPLLQNKDPSNNIQINETNETNENTLSYQYPTKEEIPTAAQLQEMEQETNHLRKKLRETRRRRNGLLLRLETLSAVDQNVKVTNKVLQDVSNQGNKDLKDIHKSVTAMVRSKEGIEQLHHEGEVLSKKLDEEKRERGDDDDDGLLLRMESPKRPKLTLDEEYKERRKLIKTTADGMANMAELLKESRWGGEKKLLRVHN